MKIELLSSDSDQAMADIAECVALQKDIGWGDEAVPAHVFRADSIGVVDPSISLGYVMIAKDTKVRGFARVTTTSDKKIHWLHEIVVEKSAQAKSLGYVIMQALQSESSSQGAEAIFFTYDPMEAQSGNLYLTKCGAVATKVYENLYGGLSSDAHSNRLTHRFLVEWWFARARTSFQPGPADLKIEIPYAVQELTPGEAKQWQLRVFAVLVDAINNKKLQAVFLEADRAAKKAFLILRP